MDLDWLGATPHLTVLGDIRTGRCPKCTGCLAPGNPRAYDLGRPRATTQRTCGACETYFGVGRTDSWLEVVLTCDEFGLDDSGRGTPMSVIVTIAR